MVLAAFGAVLLTGTTAAVGVAMDGGSSGGAKGTALPDADRTRTATPEATTTPHRNTSHTVSSDRRTHSSGKAKAPEEPTYYVHDGPKVISLTIDDGPSPVYTPQILRVLASYKVKAEFSMVGQNVSYYPEVAREVTDAGHMVANHTWSHADLTGLHTMAMRDEVARATDMIHESTGRRPTMFRAPYGAWSHELLAYLAAENLTPLDWSVDPRDWARPGVNAIVDNILDYTTTGSIILEHDGGGDRSQTVAALRNVVPRLLDAGFRFALP